MASRRLALIGCAEGPWVDISRVPRPVLEVKGLADDNAVKGHMKMSDGRDIGVHLGGNGRLLLGQEGERPVWIRLWLVVKCKSVICEIISGKVA